MSRFSFVKISNDFKINIDQSSEPSFSNQKMIDVEWEKIKENKRDLFNGKVLYYSSFKDNVLQAYIGDYKHWFVHYHNLLQPDKKQERSVLAVTGIIRQGSQLLIGKRSQQVAQHKGLFDFLPSGSLDVESNGNILQQLELERDEELYHKDRLIYQNKILGMLIDQTDNVVDVIIEMTIKMGIENYEVKNSEYSSLRILNFADKNELLNFSEFSTSTEFLLKYLYYQDFK